MIRFSEVIPGEVYRSGRYSAGGIRAVSPTIRRVIDLRQTHRPDMLAASTYRRMSLEYIRVPVDKSVEIPPETWVAIQRLLVVPTLVHCYKGLHRTGTICAMLRVTRCGWEPARAWEECERMGFGVHHEALKAGFWRWIADLDPEMRRLS